MLALQTMCKRWFWTSSLCISTVWWSFCFTWFCLAAPFLEHVFIGWWWNISHFGVFDASPSEEACAALPVGPSRVHETHGLPNNIVLICFQQMFGWIFNMFFWFGRIFELRYRWVLDPLHEQVRVTLPNIWHSDLGCSGKKKSIHNHSIIRFSRLRGRRNSQSWVEDSVDPADSANSADSAEESISELSSILGINYCFLAGLRLQVHSGWGLSSTCLILRIFNSKSFTSKITKISIDTFTQRV